MRLPRSWGCYLILTTLSLQQGTQLSLLAPLLNERGYSPALIGGLVSAISVASLVARMPSGLLYRADQARRLQGVAMPLLAVLLVLHPLATDPVVLLVIRIIDGALYGMAATINQARFIDEQPLGPGRARAMGYYVANIAIGYSIASLLVGYVVEWSGYLVAFATGALLQLVGLLGLLDRTPVIESHTAAERRPAKAGRDSASPGRPSAALNVAQLLAAPALLVGLFEGLLLNAQWAFWNAWLPLYTLAVGIGLAETGVLRTVYGVCNAVARLGTGDFVARLGAGRLVFASLVVQSLLLMLLPRVPWLAPLLVIFVVMGALRALGIVANTVAVVDQGEAQNVGRGPLVGLLNTVTDVGLLAGPAVGGLVAEHTGPVQLFFVWPLGMLACYLVVIGASRLALAHR
ncbi:MAG TPA: MFS transporter [Chloroflexota bacterium]|jgi:predicted MFS family arabinose efflux permease